MGQCTNCWRPAAATYALEFESDVGLDDLALCGSCFTFFAQSDRVDVREAPVMVQADDTEEP